MFLVRSWINTPSKSFMHSTGNFVKPDPKHKHTHREILVLQRNMRIHKLLTSTWLHEEENGIDFKSPIFIYFSLDLQTFCYENFELFPPTPSFVWKMILAIDRMQAKSADIWKGLCTHNFICLLVVSMWKCPFSLIRTNERNICLCTWRLAVWVRMINFRMNES